MVSYRTIGQTPGRAGHRRASGGVGTRPVCTGGGSICAHQRGRGIGPGHERWIERASQDGVQEREARAPLCAPPLCAPPLAPPLAPLRASLRASLGAGLLAILFVPWHCGFGVWWVADESARSSVLWSRVAR